MITITAEQLAEADTLAAEAEQDRARAERIYATNPGNSSAEKTLTAASVLAERAGARARVLRNGYDAERAAREAREAAGKDAAEGMADTAAQLVTSRENAVEAVQAAEQAIARALDALAAHDRLVRDAAADLWARGLDSEGGQATGASRSGALSLDGEGWHPVDAPSLMACSLAAAIAASHPGHPLGRLKVSMFGGAGAAAGRAALLGKQGGA